MDVLELIRHTLVSNEQISSLEHEIAKLPPRYVHTDNLIHGGMCARTILIPSGTLLTGALTNADNICVVGGDISVTTSNGVVRLRGFNVLPADSGFKRAGIAHETTFWTTIHCTDKETIEEIEQEMVAEPLELLSNKQEAAWLG